MPHPDEMTLDIAAQAVLDEIEASGRLQPQPETREGKLKKARDDAAGLKRFSATFPNGVTRRELAVPQADGPDIPVRLYRPQGIHGERPQLLVWFHGGGTIAGSLDTHEPVLGELARRTGRLVASIGYRLAPEATFPTQHRECERAARFLLDHPDLVDCDPATPAIGGDSVGGLYALHVGRRLGRVRLAAVLAIYPNTDMRPDKTHASLQENEGRIMTRDSLEFEASNAIPNEADRRSADASPLLAEDLHELPPVFLLTCEADPLRDEGEAMAERLEAAGVRLTHERLPGMIHAVLQMNGRVPAGNALMDRIGAFLRSL
ncbi:alpha/beta hydrolase [Aureimonas jatrophae]|uniref:Acetyl esterase n=1 Tax=Aureimonas jatrophae TaxID=1166073 RepID=A0A1H0IKC3_9HYPH|nr:alpha/beta hydrolase [Aureimonas jatrophae]MBB3952218.1 acetyl esterase [Aureimonas jatrophae]SDO31740.1 acetyl esterase [Aureimonas jatrophae]